MKRVKLLVAPLVAIVMSLSTIVSPAKAFDQGGFTYDWIVNIDTAHLSNYLQYQGAKLKNIVKTRVSYQPGKADDEARPTAYEDLWYGEVQGWKKPLGLERYRTFDQIGYGEHIAIRVHQKPGSNSQVAAWAAANATLRVMLDANKRDATLTAVYVPAQAFPWITSAFLEQHFNAVPEAEVNVGVHGKIVVTVVSEPDGTTQTLAYQQ